MRVSCNGCRVLRKGCGNNCSIRPCLQWIQNPQSQANATLFLVKFYGRAGLVNLINTGQENLRPAIFKSLLYEACGRIVNPIDGSVGLMWSGSWQLCQAAVEAVLKGEPITPLSSEAAIKDINIRHVSKDESAVANSDKLHKVKCQSRFKRSAPKPKSKLEPVEAKFESLLGALSGSTSGDPELSQRDSGEADSVSVQTVEDSLAKPNGADVSDVDLELTLS